MERTVKHKKKHLSLTSNAGGYPYQPHEMVHWYESVQMWDC